MYAWSTLSCLLQWLKIWRVDTYNHQDVCWLWAKCTLEQQEHYREYDPTFQRTLLQHDGTILKPSKHATQKVAYKTQSHWVYTSFENIISPLHFTYRKTKNRGTNLHVEDFVAENDAGRIQSVGQTPRPWMLQKKHTHLAIPITWWPAFQHPQLFSTHLNCLNK